MIRRWNWFITATVARFDHKAIRSALECFNARLLVRLRRLGLPSQTGGFVQTTLSPQEFKPSPTQAEHAWLTATTRPS
jgi:hypothetical protein